MSNVISIFSRPKKEKKSDKVDFDKVMEENAKKAEELKGKQNTHNKKVMRSYRIK